MQAGGIFPGTVSDNPSEGRFEALIGEERAVAEYQRAGDTITFTHTEVPVALRGQGIAAKLVRSALDQARAHRLHVVPRCPYVAEFIAEHPEYGTLVVPG